MISHFPPEDRVANFTYIELENPYATIGLDQVTIDQMNSLTLSQLLMFLTLFNLEFAHQVVGLPEVQDILRSSENSYDLLLVEYFHGFECFLPIAEKLGVPVIATVAQRSWRWADQSIGVPNNVATVPGDLANIDNVEMSFMERVENLWTSFIVDYYYMSTFRAEIDHFRRKYYPEELLQREKDVALVFYSSHSSLLPRPSVPNAVDVGGIHMKEAKPLSTDLQNFIDEAPHGVILFALGSVVRVSSMSDDQRNAFLAAFASIPQRVIWKFEESIENLPKNIMISSWLPQRDILAHKNVIAFISHCGISGVYEAIETGTPLITIPLISDQRTNAALLRYRGVAVDLNLEEVTKETVLGALDAIVNDTSYYERMQQLSRIFMDRPMTPQQSVVYWTEYVIRLNGASHLRALGSDMPLHKYLMLDVIALGLAISSFLICFVSYSVRKIRQTCTGKERKEALPAKKLM